MNRLLLSTLVTFFCLLILAACGPGQPQSVDPAQASKMVFMSVTANQPRETVASYTLIGSQAGYNGHIIAYWMCQPAVGGQPAQALSGFAIVRRYTGFQGIQNMTQGGAGLPKDDSMVEFIAIPQENPDGVIRVIFGRILSPQVKAVEVVYADGNNLRWPAGSAGFLLFRSEPVDWVRLNILGDNDQVLKTYLLAKDATTLSEREEGGGADCPIRK